MKMYNTDYKKLIFINVYNKNNIYNKTWILIIYGVEVLLFIFMSIIFKSFFQLSFYNTIF